MQCMPFYTLFPLDEIHAWARSQKKMPFYTLISELTGQTSGCYGNGGLGRFCMRSHKLRFVNYQPLQLGICLGSAVYFQWWTLLTLLEICKYYLPSSVRIHSTLLWYSPGSNKIRLHCNSCWENSGLLDPWSCHMLLSWYKHKERYLVSMQPIISLGTGASAEVDLDLVGSHLYIFWHVVSRSMSIETSY